MTNARAQLGGLIALLIIVATPASAQTAPEAAAPPQQQIAGPLPAPAVPLPDSCIGRADVLGISRIVEIDTAGGPRFGHGQYKDIDFLEDGEIVLTFDDGPIRRYTMPILDTLDAQCTRATFFSVGRMAVADPATLKETWSHKKLTAIPAPQAIDEIELGLSAVSRALGGPVAPFFRFPYLRDTKDALTHLAIRSQAVFSIDVDSRDFKTHNPGDVMRTVLAQLKTTRKGIILFHDIQPSTSGALASLLVELKARGFKVVHLIAKSPAVTLPQYDAMADKALAHNKLVLSTSPLADRAVNWPAAEGPDAEPGPPESGESDALLPWQAPGAAPASESSATVPQQKPLPPRPESRPKPHSDDDDPWQIRSFGR
jgi:peptidoglycan/xylan/chitin deacetylase (PgdA/CDA1 family)